MNLIYLINIFKKGVLLEDLLKNNSLDVNSECIEIFMDNKIDIDAELVFF